VIALCLEHGADIHFDFEFPNLEFLRFFQNSIVISFFVFSVLILERNKCLHFQSFGVLELEVFVLFFVYLHYLS